MGNLCATGAKPEKQLDLPRIHGSEPIFSIASAGGLQVATAGDDRRLCLWSCMSGAAEQTWEDAHGKAVNRLAYTHEEGLLSSGARDGSIRLWKPGHSHSLAELQPSHRMAVTGLAALGESRLMMSGSRDYSVRTWDIGTGQQVSENSTSRNVVTSMSRLPEEPVVAQASEDLRVYLWDARAMKAAAQVLPGTTDIPRCVDCSEDGRLLVTSHNGFSGEGCQVTVWDRRQGRELVCLKGHTESVDVCLFVPPTSEGAEPWVVSASKDGTVRLWDVSGGCCLCTESFPGGQCTALDLVSRETGGRADTAAAWKVPGQKRRFQRLLCAASFEGSVSLWGLGGSSSSNPTDDGSVDGSGLRLLGSSV